MVKGDQQQGFQHLAFNAGALHSNNGLMGENGHTLFNGPDIAVQLKMAQIIEKTLVEHAGAFQKLHIVLGEVQIVNSLNKLLQTGHDGIAAAIGHTAEEHIKHADFVLVAFIQITGGHGELVKIHHCGKVALYIQHKITLSVHSVFFRFLSPCKQRHQAV